MASITRIDDETIAKLSSGQVVTDCVSVVKELVENSLDAGSTVIQINLKNYGIDEISVSDNGKGMKASDVEMVGQRHCTSKLQTFDDLTHVGTFGFRGEALYSMSSVAFVEIQTSCNGEGKSLQLSTRIIKPISRKQGTTVLVKKLFHNNRIRREELIRQKNKELQKVTSLIQCYSLIHTNIRIVLSQSTQKQANILVNSSGKSLKDNLLSIFGKDAIDVDVPIDSTEKNARFFGVASNPNTPNGGRVNSDRIFLYVNRRPVSHKKLELAIVTRWRELTAFHAKRFPTVVLNISVEEYDPNVTPDKKSVFFVDEEAVLVDTTTVFNTIWPDDSIALVHTAVNPTSQSRFRPTSQNSSLLSPDRNESSTDDFVIRKSHLSQGLQALIEKRSSTLDNSLLSENDDSNTPLNLDKNPVRHKLVQSKLNITPLKSGVEIDEKLEVMENKNEESTDDKHVNEHTSAVNVQPLQPVHLMNEDIPIKKEPGIGLMQLSDNDDDDIVVNRKSVESSLEKIRKFSPVAQKIRKSEPSKCTVVTKLDDGSQQQRNQLSSGNDLDNTNSLDISAISLPSEVIEDNNNINQAVNKDDLFNQSNSSSLNNPTPMDEVNLGYNEESVHEPIENRKSPQPPSPKAKRSYSPVPPQQPIHTINNTSFAQPSSKKYSTTITIDVPPKPTLQELQSKKSLDFVSSYKLFIVPAELSAVCEHLYNSHKDYPLEHPPKTSTCVLDTKRTMNKQQIGDIEVIGQFNKGFILGKLQTDIYIIDQHAADEIYNFEKLMQKECLGVQPLLAPRKVSLAADDELFVADNINIFNQFGFHVVFNKDQPPTERVSLTAVYTRGKRTFGPLEFAELVSELRLDPSKDVILKKKRKIFATEACRMSIMVGDALTKKEMIQVLNHLTTLKKPWNCPHGRPTVRHIFDMRTAQTNLARVWK